MIRRGLAGVILGLSLLAGSLAWSGFVALRTILDPDRSEQVADEMLTNDHVRDQLVSNVGDALRAFVPIDTQVTDEQIDGAAGAVLDDPEVRALFVDALVRSHGAFLGEGTAPETLNAGVVGAAMREAIVGVAPSLDATLPASPELVIDLPTDHIPNASPIRTWLRRVVPLLAALALAGTALALLTTTNRASILRRAGTWALTTTAFVLAIGLGLPWLLRFLLPAQAELVAAFLGAVFRATLVPALALAGAGVALHLLAFFVARSEAAPRRETEPRQSRTARAATPHQTSSVRTTTAPPATPRPRPQPTAPRPAAPPPSPPTPQAQPTPPSRTAAPPTRQDSPKYPARWSEGVGWVVHPSDPNPPPHARWVAGVGYVVDGPPPRERGSAEFE